MSTNVVTEALERARLRLGKGRFYYQTNVLLPFHPRTGPFVVTHHAPFVDHVIETLGYPLAERAFGGGPAKLRHLRASQRSGIRYLVQYQGTALEISWMQATYLRRCGLAPEFIHRIPPPDTGGIGRSSVGR